LSRTLSARFGSRLSRRSWTVGFTLHVLTGFVTVLAHYSLMWILTQLGMPAVPASAVGFAAGAVTRYSLSHYAVFTPAESVPVTLYRFLIALGAQMAANSLLLAGLLAQGLSVWVAQVSTTVLLTFANYVAYRLWVFRS
jgi:putative flippase GtrA